MVSVDEFGTEGNGPRVTKSIRDKGGAFSETEIASVMSFGTGIAASVWGDHWDKGEKELLPLARPVRQLLGRIPASTLKRMEEVSLPVSILLGAWTVFGDSVMTQIQVNKYARMEKAQAAQAARGGGGLGAGGFAASSYSAPNGGSTGVGASGGADANGVYPAGYSQTIQPDVSIG